MCVVVGMRVWCAGGGIVIPGYFRAKKATDIKTATCGVFLREFRFWREIGSVALISG